MEKEELIKEKKKWAKLFLRARTEAKMSHCLLCGKSVTSFCKSHTVPKMILKNISDSGNLLTSNALFGIETHKVKTGIENTGTFFVICNDCDNTWFQDYENPENLLGDLSDKILAEIALKNYLLFLSKRYFENKLYPCMFEENFVRHINTQNEEIARNLDIANFNSELKECQNIISENRKDCFCILFRKILPYKVPIATQVPIFVYKDTNGNVLNYVYELDANVKIHALHVCVFPFKNNTLVLAFYNKKAHNYDSLRSLFNVFSLNYCLKQLNYLLFKYTEDYFLSPLIDKSIFTDKKLIALCRDFYDLEDYIAITQKGLFSLSSIGPDEIPNLLSSKFALSKSQKGNGLFLKLRNILRCK